MEYQHGKAGLGLKVKETDLAAYEKYARQYIAKELAAGKVTLDFDFSSGFTLADSLGRVVRPENPPPQSGIRFVHRVPAIQRWQLKAKRKDAPTESRTDHHAFFFDVTDCLPDKEKFKLEADAGIDRTKKKKK